MLFHLLPKNLKNQIKVKRKKCFKNYALKRMNCVAGAYFNYIAAR
jgi:hypothetical protein